MRFDVLTLFPEMFRTTLGDSIIGKACDKGIIEVNCVNIRDFSEVKHRKVDDYAYGGGVGMVMQPEPIYNAYKSLDDKPFLIYMSPQGTPLTQSLASELSKKKHVAILCGHYEGVDERLLEEIVDLEVSIGDYVLTGGEIPAMALIDCVSRLVPGVLSDEVQDSHYDGLLEYPQYTRPEVFMGKSVPEVLLSGHLENITAWKKRQSIMRTRLKRPDLYEKYASDRPKIAIFGGTFDPIHNGHLHVAESALNELGLDKVIFVPAGNPPHKCSGTDKRHRYNMVRIATLCNPQFEVSDYEVRRKSLSYTVETLKYFEKKYPGARLYYIVGADALREMSGWYQPQEIFEIADIVCAGREGEKKYETAGANVVYLEAADYNASSTAIRKGLFNELPKGVAEYINKHEVYKS